MSGAGWDPKAARIRGEVMGGLVPPPIVASPSDMPPPGTEALAPDFLTMFEGRDVPFWRPGIPEVLVGIGWKWILLLPSVLFAIGLPLGMIFSHQARFQFASFLKLWMFAIGVAITIVLGAVRRGISARRGAFCIHCGYSLEGLGGRGTCPECGRTYDTRVLAEYLKDPHFFATRCRTARNHHFVEGFLAGSGPTPSDGTH